MLNNRPLICVQFIHYIGKGKPLWQKNQLQNDSPVCQCQLTLLYHSSNLENGQCKKQNYPQKAPARKTWNKGNTLSSIKNTEKWHIAASFPDMKITDLFGWLCVVFQYHFSKIWIRWLPTGCEHRQKSAWVSTMRCPRKCGWHLNK